MQRKALSNLDEYDGQMGGKPHGLDEIQIHESFGPVFIFQIVVVLNCQVLVIQANEFHFRTLSVMFREKFHFKLWLVSPILWNIGILQLEF